jgi:toxin ParE1/3/4
VTPIKFSDPASEDLAAAVQWYEHQRPGLGSELLAALDSVLVQIQVHPESGSPRQSRPSIRQVRVSRFPYLVVYRIRDGEAQIIAIAHTSRRPDYWRHRVG